jgi:hypothetical protein
VSIVTEFMQEIEPQLDDTWKSLREIAEGAGYQLSGSSFETVCDRLVEYGRAEVKLDKSVRAPMGKLYRRKAS